MKGVDVSVFQGKIDWKAAKYDGVQFAVIKIITKSGNKDKQFEDNWSGCIRENVPIYGVYNYSYATSVAKAVADAQRVVQVLDGRKTTVWLDWEDACLPTGSLAAQMINAYGDVVTAAGLPFGLYFGEYYYKTHLKPIWSQIKDEYKLYWVARYPNSTTHDMSYEPNMKYCPDVIGKPFAWQYSSKGRVNGISGNVDLNIILDAKNQQSVLVASPTIKYGDKNAQAKILQQDLNQFGFGLVCDGIVGNATIRALKVWQKEHGLVSDGIYGKKSANRMYELLSK